MNGELEREARSSRLCGARHEGLDTNQLAECVDLHPNTIRRHLGVLTDTGLVHAIPQRRHGRGVEPGLCIAHLSRAAQPVP